MRGTLIILAFVFASSSLFAQDQKADIEELKKEILELRSDYDQISSSLRSARNQFKTGITVATLGYAVTIAGGLMLGRANDDLGKVLLVAGGVTGVTGTVIMVNSFNKLAPPDR